MCDVRNVVKLEGKGGFKAIQVRQMTCGCWLWQL